MTASDVREKDREAADLFIASERFDELTASNMYVTLTTEAFLAGIQHARSEQEGLVAALERYAEHPDEGIAALAEEALAGWRGSK
jgi:hypothetical protein